MKNAHLKAYKISEINFKNEVNGTVNLNFSSRVSHNVKYNGKNNLCEAKTSVQVSDPKQPDTISLSLEVSGIFEYNKDATKEELHVETAKELFTYAKTFITTITAVAGIKPITINDIDFDAQNIIRYNTGDIRRSLGKQEPPKFDDLVDGPDGVE